MHRTTFRIFILTLFAPAAIALAQQAAAPPAPRGTDVLIEANKGLYGGVSQILLRAAESMPEEHYGFKPVDSVRTFGQIVGHVADSQYYFCSTATGLKNPAPKVEQTKKTKADLVAGLKEAIAYCDKAHASMNHESAVEMVKFMGGDSPRMNVLSVNNVHTIEHYGNLVTYLRMKNVVPPTSDPEFMKNLTR